MLLRSVASLSLPETLNLTFNAQARCTQFKLFQLRPIYGDCVRAVDLLSSSPATGHFHAGGSIDKWQLPVTETEGTCEVSVQLAPFSLPELSSWGEIKKTTRELSEACRSGVITGGLSAAGPHERILISVARRRGMEG